MDLVGFTRTIARLSEDEIRLVAHEIEAHHASAADEVAWWQATVSIDRLLKATGRSRAAAMAALQASKSVQAAATAAGCALPDDDVTHVARAAAEVARGITAGEHAVAAVSALLGCWTPVLGSEVLTAA